MDAGSITLLVVLGVALIFMMIVMPQMRKRKQGDFVNTMHSLAIPGATIKTIGGMVAKILEIKQISPKEKQMILEVGEGEHKIQVSYDFAALYQIVTLANGEPFKPEMLMPKKAGTTDTSSNTTDSTPTSHDTTKDTDKAVFSETDNTKESKKDKDDDKDIDADKLVK